MNFSFYGSICEFLSKTVRVKRIFVSTCQNWYQTQNPVFCWGCGNVCAFSYPFRGVQKTELGNDLCTRTLQRFDVERNQVRQIFVCLKKCSQQRSRSLKALYVRFELLRRKNYVLCMEIQVNFKYLSFIQNPFRLLQILNQLRFHLTWSHCAFSPLVCFLF